MKTYWVIVTPLALEHIQRITDYIADFLQAPDTALRWLDKAEHVCIGFAAEEYGKDPGLTNVSL